MVAQTHRDRGGIVYAIGHSRVSLLATKCNLELQDNAWEWHQSLNKGTTLGSLSHYLGQNSTKTSHTVNIMCRDMQYPGTK